MSHTYDLTNNWPLAPHRSSDRLSLPWVRLNFTSAAKVVLFLLPVYLLLLWADQPSFYSQFAIALLALLGLCTYLFWKGHGWVLASIFLVAACFQNLYLGILLNYQQYPVLVPILVLVETKTAVLYGGFVIVVVYVFCHRKAVNWKADWGTLCGALFVVVLLSSYFLSSAPAFSKIAEARNLLAPAA